MKKLFTLLLIITTLNVFGQKKDSVLTDSTKFLSLKDINVYSQKYKDVATWNEYQSFLNIMNAIIKEAIEDYKKKKPQ
jgi:hypothetical protein